MYDSDEKYRILKDYFGHDEFRKGQEEIIDSIISGRDVVCIMPTGAGKSMCYQIPAIMNSGTTLVISPLISLMQDQVQSLVQIGVRAAYINSTLTPQQYDRVTQLMMNNAYKIVYISPERLKNEAFVSICTSINISMVVVDEAHCVSHWGQDFRPSYMKISEFVKKFPKRPVIGAFTATATERVKLDMKNLLELDHPFSVTTGFDRPNLFFTVLRPYTKVTALLEMINERYSRCGIIYCTTRRTVEKVCALINENGFRAVQYHGGLSEAEKKKNQDDFVFDRVPIMVATNAFGMGIDKSNVSYVIHFNMPKDLESYYQEAGRAGRDGSEAECILLYNPSDLRILKRFIENIDDNPDLSDETKKKLKLCEETRLKFMILYCTTTDCLRWFMLRYFGERKNCRCGKCSNCVSQYELADVTETAQKILSCVVRTRQVCNIDMICDVLLGHGNEMIKDAGFDKIPTYGIMKNASVDKIRSVINVLILRNFVDITDDRISVLKINKLSVEILKGKRKVVTNLLTDKKFSVNEKMLESGVDEGLMKILKELRKKMASKASVPAYVIFTDATLREMCRRLPKTRSALASIPGVGALKLDKYGEEFIDAISEYEREK